ncbi:MAG: DUF2182 domain-containing protein [Burkholderiaceae bacterium]|nr:DUF2182 domain-containing protein [Burkholderiaceae bacterium]
MTSTHRVDEPRAATSGERRFLAVSALVFFISAGATVAWCESMRAVAAMPMWMPLCGRRWTTQPASFLGMWTVMMAAMMLPSLVPMLQRYRRGVPVVRQAQLDALTVLVGVAYLAVWVGVGAAVLAGQAGLAVLEMVWPRVVRGVPAATGAIVLAAGAVQLSAWKARQLAGCRTVPASGGMLRAGPRHALRYGARLGIQCVGSCAALTSILLVAGAMDLWAMAAVSAAITLERLAPFGDRAARLVGAAALGSGAFLVVRALVPG